ncbi:hypothetical protein GGS23DRAFT_208055 [Durotheca rogersii]|uniref:uncharacterized protein n=1 Tax=Durotheca rogersii TaxID=419775 RepID=UPI002220FF9C|nr:uncharacterized protein GGS23DRAFT_208055 [Durotheca rogersii]KAI5861081.1 hypothetical protein GGS23DRAFT_208055 [Durotheca rogersii]
MPAKPSSNGAASATSVSSTANMRFELPALEFAFGSLTDGTDIPPPPPSPKEKVPTPPKTPIVDEAEKKQELASSAANGHGSIINQNASRPPSRTASTVAEEKKSKRSSGWFRRLRPSDHAKRVSQHFEEVKKSSPDPSSPGPSSLGPPPPMIPELSALESKVDTRLGDDLFKEIK